MPLRRWQSTRALAVKMSYSFPRASSIGVMLWGKGPGPPPHFFGVGVHQVRNFAWSPSLFRPKLRHCQQRLSSTGRDASTRFKFNFIAAQTFFTLSFNCPATSSSLVYTCHAPDCCLVSEPSESPAPKMWNQLPYDVRFTENTNALSLSRKKWKLICLQCFTICNSICLYIFHMLICFYLCTVLVSFPL